MVKPIKRFKIYRMKKRIVFYLLFFWIVFFGACSTPKKISTSSKEKTNLSEVTTESKAGQSSFFTDTTKSAKGEVIYTKIEYYPPGPELEPGGLPENKKPKHPPDVNNIKSIETLFIKQERENKGVSEQKGDTTSAKAININNEIIKDEESETEPTADPYKYRYIFGIIIAGLGIVIAAYFFLRKTKLFTSVISFFK